MIHFVYAVPFPSGRLNKALGRMDRLLRRWIPGLPAPWRAGLTNWSGRVIPAPSSITQHLFTYLASRRPTLLYDLDERIALEYAKDDIIIGHPWPHPNSVMQQVMRNPRKCRLKALIFPIHHGIPSINHYAAPLVEMADLVFGIMGLYWYDTLETSVFASWKEKIVRLDMAIDATQYPRVKFDFNPPGQRGYLYIGKNQPEKGPDILSRTMAGLREFKRGWIGSGDDMPNICRLCRRIALTEEVVAKLASEYDIFVNTSLSDANPTTILEAMAWGFPVACTPQSGYYNMPNIVTLSTTDIGHNIRVLRALQSTPDSELKRISEENAALVKSYYTWDRFCETVWGSLSRYL